MTVDTDIVSVNPGNILHNILIKLEDNNIQYDITNTKDLMDPNYTGPCKFTFQDARDRSKFYDIVNTVTRHFAKA